MGARARPNGSVSGHQDLKTELEEKLEVVDVHEMSGLHQQCIYQVAEKIREVNPKAYTPRVVSIGPFHKPRRSGGANNILEPMEELKLKHLKGFLNRTKRCVGDFVLKLEEWENRIQSCYARPANYDSNDFLRMIIIDACFIIEHFLRYYTRREWIGKDPLILMLWLRRDISNDLILLENQLPFFVLEDIYNLADINQNPYGTNCEFPSFLEITFHYFKQHNSQNTNPESVSPKHFTDLLRTFWLSSSIFDLGRTEEGDAIEHVYSASQLSEAGLEFKVKEQSTCLLDIEYQKGVLTMPRLTLYDTTELYMRNIMAFERYHLPNKSAYLSQYFKILDFLIDTEKDVGILVDKKIIVNRMGDASSVATMVNNLLKNFPSRRLNSKYLSLCKSLNNFYENPRNKYKAIFINEYFNTPWKKASTFAAVLLLFLTLIQSVCSVWSLLKG